MSNMQFCGINCGKRRLNDAINVKLKGCAQKNIDVGVIN